MSLILEAGTVEGQTMNKINKYSWMYVRWQCMAWRKEIRVKGKEYCGNVLNGVCRKDGFTEVCGTTRTVRIRPSFPVHKEVTVQGDRNTNT